MNSEIDMLSIFEKGASDYLESSGLPSGYACNVASAMGKEMGKEAARRAYDDDEGGLWDSVKGWLVPSAVGVAALMLGDYVGKHGRRDRNAFQNAYDLISKKLRDAYGDRLDSPLRAFDTKDLETKDKSAVGTKLI